LFYRIIFETFNRVGLRKNATYKTIFSTKKTNK
jgi:hypothetical protein